MSGSAHRIVLTNCVLLNTGDAAIALGILDRVADALDGDVSFVVAGNAAEVSAKYYPHLELRPLVEATFPPVPDGRLGRLVRRSRELRLVAGAWCTGRRLTPLTRLWLGSRQRAALAEYRRADVVVSTGGTYLVETYRLDGRLLELRVALAMRRPLIVYTQSLGPFYRPRNRRAVRSVLRRARLVLLRDERSRRHLADIGVGGSRVRVVADAAFALDRPPSPERRPPELNVAVSVRDWPFASGEAGAANRRYRLAIAAVVDRLVREHGARVTFISTCQGVPEYWYDDSRIAQEIAEGLAPEVRSAVAVDSGFHAPGELTRVLATFDLVVATRMHAAILALVAGTPVFPLAYEFKTRELFERLGLGEWVRDFEAVDPVELPEAIERFLTAIPQLTEPLSASVAAERASATEAAGLVAEALGLQVAGRRATTA